MEAYRFVDGAVRAWAIPGDPAAAGAPRFPAASVTLRLEGQVFGRGTDAADDGLALARALRQAMIEADGRLPGEHDALWHEQAREAGARTAISVEVGGPLVPIALKVYTDSLAEVAPGLDGVAVRAGDRLGAMFPGTMLVTSTGPASAYAGLVSRLTGDATAALRAPADLTERDGLVFYRFEVTHLAQPRSAEPPVFLSRGGRTIGLQETDIEGLRDMARGIAGHLLARRWTGPEPYGLRGTLLPTRGEYTPHVAGPAAQALAALALHEFAASGIGGTDLGARAASAVLGILGDLARVAPDEDAPWADVPASALVVGLCARLEPSALATDPDIATLVSRSRERLLTSLTEAGGFAEDVPAGAEGAVAWAAVRDAQAGAGNLERARLAVRTAFRVTPPEMLPGQMPFLAWAELELGDPAVAAAVALRQARRLTWEHQVRAWDLAPRQRDLAGGIRFTRAAGALPDWNTARVVAGLAAMTADPRVTDPSEAPAELARLLEAMRFIRQLAADDALGHMYTAPDLARWGVRSSVWDQRMPPEASSAGLLATCRVIGAIESLARLAR